MMSHRDERQLVCEAFRRVFGREPNRTEAQCVQAVSWLETQYGSGWKPPGKGSRNRGAITAGREWFGATFEYRDSRPPTKSEIASRAHENAAATGAGLPVPHADLYAPVWYTTKFRAYTTEIDAVVDLVKMVYLNARRDEKVLPAARRGDTYSFSAGLHATRYYTGTSVDPTVNITRHHKKVLDSIRAMAKALGEPMPDGSEPIADTVELGATGDRVKQIQCVVGVKQDGSFGPKTQAAVMVWQRQHGLKADGKVGPITWTAMFGVKP